MPIDRDFVAEQLEFDGLVSNSLDSSSDRDYMIEFVFCLCIVFGRLLLFHLFPQNAKIGQLQDQIQTLTTENDFLVHQLKEMERSVSC